METIRHSITAYSTGIASITFDGTLQTVFMILFFTTVGFTVSIPALLKGGKAVMLCLIVSIVMIPLQNFLGGGVMEVFGCDPDADRKADRGEEQDHENGLQCAVKGDGRDAGGVENAVENRKAQSADQRSGDTISVEQSHLVGDDPAHPEQESA